MSLANDSARFNGAAIPSNPAQSIDEIARSWAECYRRLVHPGQIVELRALGVRRGNGWPHTEAGFFDSEHLDEMARIALGIPYSNGIYYTPNPLNPDLLARCQNRID